MKNIIIILMGIISLMYLLNIGVGVIELIPDNIPFVGNLDEAGAAALLIMCLRYFGLDFTRIFQKSSKKTEKTKSNAQSQNQI
ncbi:MAG: DUF1232 domain-containing protein [Calditrichaceae bacterium]|nr:DUF1232 domain-containing protein [Calditrichaceae bacterium]